MDLQSSSSLIPLSRTSLRTFTSKALDHPPASTRCMASSFSSHRKQAGQASGKAEATSDYDPFFPTALEPIGQLLMQPLGQQGAPTAGQISGRLQAGELRAKGTAGKPVREPAGESAAKQVQQMAWQAAEPGAAGQVSAPQAERVAGQAAGQALRQPVNEPTGQSVAHAEVNRAVQLAGQAAAPFSNPFAGQHSEQPPRQAAAAVDQAVG